MFVTIVVSEIAIWLTEPAQHRFVFPLLAIGFVGNSVAYVLARLGAGRASAWTIVLNQIGTPLALPILFPMNEVIRPEGGSWVALGVLTASATLSSRSVLVVGALTITAFLTVWMSVGAEFGAAVFVALFIGAITALVYVYSVHRDTLEAKRQQQLQLRNAELEELRASLEERVQTRTAQLEAANQAVLDGQHLLISSEKMAAVGRLTAGFAHELSTPLSSVASSLETLDALRGEYAESVGDANVTTEDHLAISQEMQSAIAIARTANRTALQYVKGIRAHTRDPGPQAVEHFDANTVVAQAIELVAHLARAANVELKLEPAPEPASIWGVPSRFNQAITNLVSNAIDAVAGTAAGSVCVRVQSGAAHTIVEVEDNGTGIRPEVLAKMFEPLFTTKPYGQGTGLGLAIVDEIVRKELGGDIEVRTQVGAGSTFVLKTRQERGGADGA